MRVCPCHSCWLYRIWGFLSTLWFNFFLVSFIFCSSSLLNVYLSPQSQGFPTVFSVGVVWWPWVPLACLYHLQLLEIVLQVTVSWVGSCDHLDFEIPHTEPSVHVRFWLKSQQLFWRSCLSRRLDGSFSFVAFRVLPLLYILKVWFDTGSPSPVLSIWCSVSLLNLGRFLSP